MSNKFLRSGGCALLLMAGALNVLLAVKAGAQVAGGAPVAAEKLDLKGYIAEIDRVSAALESVTNPKDAEQLKASIPAQWTVEQDGISYVVPTRELTDGITALGANPAKTKQTRKFLSERLAALKASAQGLENVAAPAKNSALGANSTDARARLQRILSRREFGSVKQPTWWDRLKERIAWWIYRLWMKLFGAAGRSPRTGYILMWGVIVLAFGLLAFAAWGWLSRRSEALGLNLGDAAPPPRKWREWLADARDSAKRGDYRNAIRCAYWAAIFRLEEAGRWRVNLDLTPREYLRKLTEDDHQRPPLNDLTRCFELTWYGYQPATSSEFEFVNRQLERLGCLPPSTAATPGS